MKKVVLFDNYGPFRAGREYFVKKSGPDWIALSSKGSIIYVSKALVDPNPHRRKKKRRKDEEDLLEDYEDLFFA